MVKSLWNITYFVMLDMCAVTWLSVSRTHQSHVKFFLWFWFGPT